MGLDVKPVYTLNELSLATRWTKSRVLRFLRKNGVQVARAGNRIVITASALKKEMPDFLESLRECGSLEAFDPGEYP